MTNDPELQHLVQQTETDKATLPVVGASDNDDETRPLTSNSAQDENEYDAIESGIKSTLNVPKPKKSKSKHQALPSESMDDESIAAEQTTIIQEKTGTNSANTSISPIEANQSIPSDATEFMTPKTPLVCQVIRSLHARTLMDVCTYK